MQAQLGFDPLSRDGQLAPGSTRTGPLRWCAAGWRAPRLGRRAPAHQAGPVRATVDRLLRERAAFAVRQDEARGGPGGRVLPRRPADRVAFASCGDTASWRAGGSRADVAATAERDPAQSLAQDARLAAARKQLGART